MPKKFNYIDFEILIRRRDANDFASYCPQLLYMIKGKSQIEVKSMMEKFIENYAATKALENSIVKMDEQSIESIESNVMKSGASIVKESEPEMNIGFKIDENENDSDENLLDYSESETIETNDLESP